MQPRVDKRRLRELVRARFKNRTGRGGFLVAFEGPDGSGKTTQRKLFKAWLKSEGVDVVTTKWNSSDLVKPLIKSRKEVRALSPEEFSLLHAADFRHRVEHVILPALWEGKLVIADRFLFTGLARDVARGLDLDWVLHLYEPLLWPDLVFYFAVSPDTSGRRVTATRTPNFYEAGRDVTDLEDPVESYQRFVTRVIKEYESLGATLVDVSLPWMIVMREPLAEPPLPFVEVVTADGKLVELPRLVWFVAVSFWGRDVERTTAG